MERLTPRGSWLLRHAQVAVFVVLSISGGAAVAVLTPPFQAPDEPAHLFRAYAISEGRLVTDRSSGSGGEFVPVSFLRLAGDLMKEVPRNPEARIDRRDLLRAFEVPLRPSEQSFLPEAPGLYTAGMATPVGYIPAAVAITLARVVDAPALLHIYAARAANLLASTLLIAVAIWRVPFGRWLIATIGMLPMTLFLRASASSDAMTIALGLLLTAELLRSWYRTDRLEAKEGATLAMLALLVAMTKPMYAALSLLVVMVPFSRPGGPGRALLLRAGVPLAAAIGFGASLWWGGAFRVSYGAIADAVPSAATAASDPARFLSAAARTIWHEWPYWMEQFAGRLGWLDVPVPALVRLLLIGVILLLGASARPPRGIVRPAQRLVALGSGMTVFLLMALAFYSGEELIRGIQGRYFLPAAALALPLLSTSLVVPEKALSLAATAASFLSVVVTVAVVMARYY